MVKDLKQTYHTILGDHFPQKMEIAFYNDNGERSVLQYQKVGWEIDGEVRGLRYGENPGQEAALYRLVNGNLTVGNVKTIAPGRYLVSDAELLQFGKHPGKINLTDADNALNILRYLTHKPACAIMKHNNPSGVAVSDSLVDAYVKADMADRIAAYGGAIALNRPIDRDTAKAISERYAEVVAAPGFEEGAVEILKSRPNLRIMQIENMNALESFAPEKVLDFKSLIDGGVIVQTSFTPENRSRESFLPAQCEFDGKLYTVERQPTDAEWDDMIFGWMVEAGVTSNSVIYVKDGVTVGIGTGEQDRVGVAQIARDKAYRKLADRIAFTRYNMAFMNLTDKAVARAIEEEAAEQHGGLIGATMISDAFFPFRDGIDVGLSEGVRAVVQPGGSVNDYQSITACNEVGATMVFTGQRSFKH